MTPAPKRLQRDALSNDTHFGVTAECDSSALSLVSDKPYGEPLQRGSIRRGEQAQITMATEAAMQAHDIYTKQVARGPATGPGLGLGGGAGDTNWSRFEGYPLVHVQGGGVPLEKMEGTLRPS